MIIGRISGTVVCTSKVEALEGFKLLLVSKLNLEGEETGDFVVAVDCVGAGANEKVLLVSGSSSRQTKKTEGKPVDAAVVGIIDAVDINQ